MVEITRTAFYARMKVWNLCGASAASARNVQVQAVRLEVCESGSFNDDPSFMPLNLKWSHTGAINHSVIHPSLFRHCDVCHLIQGENGFPVQLELDIEVRPNRIAEDVWPTVKGSGLYRLHLVIVADDIKPLRKALEIRVPEKWNDDEAAMFSARGFQIRVV